MNAPARQLTLSRAEQDTLAMISRFVAGRDRSPSLGEIGLALRVSRSRVCAILRGLERKGQITRRRGEPLSIRLPDPMAALTDDALLEQIATLTREQQRRGLSEAAAAAGVSLATAYEPCTIRQRETPAEMCDLLSKIDGDAHEAGRGQ